MRSATTAALARLALAHRHPPASLRAEGSVTLRELDRQAADSVPAGSPGAEGSVTLRELDLGFAP